MKVTQTNARCEAAIAIVYLGNGGNFFVTDEEQLREALKMYHDKGWTTYVFRKEVTE